MNAINQSTMAYVRTQEENEDITVEHSLGINFFLSFFHSNLFVKQLAMENFREARIF